MIKNLEDYTKQELSALTETDIQQLIDYECMKVGAPLNIMTPVYAAPKQVEQPDITAYSFGSICLTDKAEADAYEAFVKTLNSIVSIDYDWKSGASNRHKYCEPKKPTDTAPMKSVVYSMDTYNKVKETLRVNALIDQENEEKKKAFTKTCEARKPIADKVNDTVLEATRHEALVTEATTVFDRYVELSSGDTEIATKFFKTSKYTELLPELRSKHLKIGSTKK